MPKITLTFICKNNADTIGRMIDSCLPVIDMIIANDTGSTDNTVEIIKSYSDRVSVRVFEEPWKNFAHNRTVMMTNACAFTPDSDLILIMDTDETLEISPDFKKEDLTGEAYLVRTNSGDMIYYRERIVSAKYEWIWKGFAHEYLVSPPGLKPYQRLDSLTMIVYSKQQSFARNIIRNYKLLMEDYKQDPENSRTVFYLAESCRDLRWLDDAIEFYAKRIRMGGYPEEVYYSMYQLAIMYDWIGEKEKAKEWLYKAIEKRPGRAEAMYYLAQGFQKENRHDLAVMYFERIVNMPDIKDSLFVFWQIKDYLAEFQLSVSAYHAEEYDKAYHLSLKLKSRKLPKDIQEQNLKNIVYYRRKWNELHPDEKEYVLETPYPAWEGLGDHLFLSPMPRILKEVMGFKKVWISNFMHYKTPGVKKLVWENNPYVDGFIDEYGMIDDYRQMCHDMMRAAINSKHKTVVNRLMDLYIGHTDANPEGLPWVNIKQFQPLITLTDKVVFDGNWKSFSGLPEKLVLDWFEEHGYPDYQIGKFEGTNYIELPGVPVLPANDLTAYGSIIGSSKEFICMMSGGAVLAAAMRCRAIVLDSVCTRSDIFRFNEFNVYYLLDYNPPAPRKNFYDRDDTVQG